MRPNEGSPPGVALPAQAFRAHDGEHGNAGETVSGTYSGKLEAANKHEDRVELAAVQLQLGAVAEEQERYDVTVRGKGAQFGLQGNR